MHAVFMLIILLKFATTTKESEACVKVTRFKVPSSVRLGEPVKLGCEFELTCESLHALKLFKDDREFYRYTPSARSEDRRLAFPVPGIVVVRSNETEVVLRGARKDTAGLFRCQVVVEGTFKSMSVERRLDVVSSAFSPMHPQSTSAGSGGGGGSRQQNQQQNHPNQANQPSRQSGFLANFGFSPQAQFSSNSSGLKRPDLGPIWLLFLVALWMIHL